MRSRVVLVAVLALGLWAAPALPAPRVGLEMGTTGMIAVGGGGFLRAHRLDEGASPPARGGAYTRVLGGSLRDVTVRSGDARSMGLQEAIDAGMVSISCPDPAPGAPASDRVLVTNRSTLPIVVVVHAPTVLGPPDGPAVVAPTPGAGPEAAPRPAGPRPAARSDSGSAAPTGAVRHLDELRRADDQWIVDGLDLDLEALAAQRRAAERDQAEARQREVEAWAAETAAWPESRRHAEQTMLEELAKTRRMEYGTRVGLSLAAGQLGVPHLTHSTSPDVSDPGMEIQPDLAIGVFVLTRLSARVRLSHEVAFAFRGASLGSGHLYCAPTLPAIPGGYTSSDDAFEFRSLEYRPTVRWGGTFYVLGGGCFGKVLSAKLKGGDSGSGAPTRDVLDAVNESVLGWRAGVGVERRFQGEGIPITLELERAQMVSQTFRDWDGAIGSWVMRIGFSR